MIEDRTSEIIEQFGELAKSIRSFVEQEQNDKRMLYRIIAILIISFFLAITSVVGGFLWYLNQYDFVSYEYQQDATDGGDNSFIGGDGDIINGETEDNSTNP